MIDVIIFSILAILIFVLFASFDICGLRVGIYSFDKKWPPIDDDEFMRRCRAGTDRAIALKVRRIIATQLGIPYNQIYPEQNFINDLNC